MKLYDFKTRLNQLNKYLPLLPGPHGHRLDDADMFDTIQECVPDWNNSYIASNTTTENINDLLEYYGKLELQEAKRKPKTRRQDNSKSQQQPARNQNQRRQGNQNQRSGNNRCNEESFCSYHQLRGHSDAECRDPRNPRGANANNQNNTRRNERSNNRDRNHQQDRNYRNNQDSRNNQQRNHRYPTRSQQQREESHQQQEALDDRSQHTTNHSESDDEIFALEEKRNINANDQNIIKQDYVPEIAIGVLADVVTKRYKYLRALIDSGSSSSIICESSMPDPIKKKIKDDPSGETKWTTKGGTYITTGEANIWFQLTEVAPSRLFKHKFKVDRDAKSTSYDIILGRDAMKELQFNLLYSENIPKIRFEQGVEIDCKPRGFWSRSRLHRVYFQAQQSTIDKAEEEFLEKRCFSQAQYQAADLHKCLPNHLSS
jgi:hypothetical protein